MVRGALVLGTSSLAFEKMSTGLTQTERFSLAYADRLLPFDIQAVAVGFNPEEGGREGPWVGDAWGP